MVARKMEMRDFAFLLVMTTHRPVIDRTGLTGRFNFDLDFAPLDSDAAADSSAPSLFTAIQEQLDLRLDTTKAPLIVWLLSAPKGLRELTAGRLSLAWVYASTATSPLSPCRTLADFHFRIRQMSLQPFADAAMWTAAGHRVSYLTNVSGRTRYGLFAMQSAV
jgi:hypothetical protein